LNINQVNFPVYILNPTSLKIEAGCQFDILNLLNDLIHHIENWYTRLLAMETQKLEKAYEEALFGFNETVDFEEAGRLFSAKIVGVDSAGQLKLEMPGGEIRKYGFKEVMYKL
jgi:BirA family biotin operon repressor/biotin-[acetyl-CoA-carboxylase] ligase